MAQPEPNLEINPAPTSTLHSEPEETLDCGVQTLFRLDAKAWDEFLQLLNEPPRELPALKKLLHSKSVWEA